MEKQAYASHGYELYKPFLNVKYVDAGTVKVVKLLSNAIKQSQISTWVNITTKRNETAINIETVSRCSIVLPVFH